jgi:hypothetical protein
MFAIAVRNTDYVLGCIASFTAWSIAIFLSSSQGTERTRGQPTMMRGAWLFLGYVSHSTVKLEGIAFPV